VIHSRLGISGNQILARDRHSRFVDARQIAVLLLHDVLLWNYTYVGAATGRNRNQIARSSKAGNDKVDTEKKFKAMFLCCLNELQTKHPTVFYAKETSEETA